MVGLGCGRKRGQQGCVHRAKTFGLRVTVGSDEQVWGKHQECGTRPGLGGSIADTGRPTYSRTGQL